MSIEQKRFFAMLTAFRGLFFASGTVVIDGGDGGDGGGAGDGGAGGGDGEEVIEGDEGAGDEGAGDEEVVEGDEDTEGEGDGEGAGDDDAAGGRDGRTMPKDVKNALAKLAETDPKAAKIARKAYYEAADFKAVGTLHQIRQMRDTFEEVGGSEGIATLQEESREYAAELKSMFDGNPESLDALIKDSPAGFKKLVPEAVSRFQKLDPDGYERMSAGIIASTLKDRGITSSIARIAELIQDGKQQPGFDLAQKVLKWLSDAEAYSKTAPQATGTEKDKDLSAREERIAAQEKQTFGNRVGGQSIELLHKEMDVFLNPLFKQGKLSANPRERQEQIKDLRNGIRTEIASVLASRPGYKAKMQALIDQGDEQAILRYLRGQVRGDMTRKAVNRVWARRGFAAAPARKAGARGAAGAGAGNTRPTMGKKPSAAEIDWSKDRGRARYMRGEATLRNGKVVKWDINAL